VKNKKKNKQQIPVPGIKRKLFIFLFFLVAVPSVIYLNVVNFGYSGLDDSSITQNVNSLQGNPLNLGSAFTHDAFMGDKGDTFYRPMQVITFMLDAHVAGNEPWIYHLSNLILHLLTVIALFFFLKKTGVKEEISFLIALLFSINPLFTNAVAWIPARGDILLCLFSLLSFITFIEYFESKKIVYAVMHTIVFLMAVFSKETVVLIPFIILSFYYFVQKRKFVLKDIYPFLIVWFSSFLLFFLLRQSVIKVNPSSNVFGVLPFIRNLPTIPVTFFKFFFPYNLCTMPFFDNISLIGGSLLIAAFAGLIYKLIRTEWRSVIWGGLWFLLLSIPPMFYRSYFAGFGYEYFEYRVYLPIIGILFIGGFIINKLTTGIPFRKLLMISIPVLTIYAAITFIHLKDFANPISFFTSAINNSSNNAVAFCSRGIAYYNLGDHDKALSDFDNSIRACPVYPNPYFNKGVFYNSLKDHNKAEYFFSQALKYNTLSSDANMLGANIYLNLSFEKNALRKYSENKALLLNATGIYPKEPKLHYNLGILYYSTTKFDSALYEYSKAIELDKNNFSYYDNRGMARFHLKDFKGALNDFNRVIDLKPDYKDVWGSRGMTRLELNEYEGAIFDLSRSISYSPNEGAGYYYRGIAYSKIPRVNEARADWEKAVGLGYKNAAILLNKIQDNTVRSH
jgi:protein O-mannosyl-transferase